jgi:hypothetical protein
MPQPPITKAAAEETVFGLLAALKAGHSTGRSIALLAEKLGISPPTIYTRLRHNGPISRSFPELYQQFLDASRARPAQEVEFAPAAKPRVSVRAGASPEGETIRVCAIGDVHDSPTQDKERFKWFGRHIAATRPDKVVQIGDLGDFHSCSSHEPVGSLSAALKPSYRRDLDSLEEALTLIHKEIAGGNIALHLVEGNHEDRIYRFQDLHPEADGMFVEAMHDVLARFDWRFKPYGEFLFIAGVGFVHAPKTIMGRAYGGKNSEQQIGNDALFSIVWGHTHRAVFKQIPKIGPSQHIEVLNLGSAMPQGYVAPYAGTATTGWTYGVFDLELRGGHIVGHRFIGMDSLREMYRD